MEHTTERRGGHDFELDEQRCPPQGAMAWPDHDQVPVPEHGFGAWLYVVSRQAWDDGKVCGAWVPAGLGEHDVAMVVSSAVGQSLSRWDLAVVDQVGLDAMVDEDCFVPDELPR